MMRKARISDPFWTPYERLVRETVIPYQWEMLNDRVPGAEPSHCMKNFRIAAGLEEGNFGGFVFQDSDLAKWLEAVGHSLASHPDPELERIADEAIDLALQAQWDDGYLNTYFSIEAPEKRWTNLTDCHELYCAGHMIEAAVAYYEATGKRKLLDAMCRFADYIDSVFGTEPGKIRGYDGHQEIELALVKLYNTTGNERYLKLSQYFIDERGREPKFFEQEWEARGQTSFWNGGAKAAKPHHEYHQSHLPVREQTKAVGHAVRAVYMYTAMADLARLTGDTGLLEACRKLWDNMTTKQMYITGGIGSTHHGEAFTFDYDLPNDTVYAETCASIGLIFFAQRMLQLEADSKYADVIERALHNLVLAGMSKDGHNYFYVNPLEVWPEASAQNPGKHHVKPARPKWYGCACCPPNIARLISSLGDYIYTADEKTKTVYAHLFIGSEFTLHLGDVPVTLQQQSSLPWEGNVKLQVSPKTATRFTLALRIPSWCADRPRLLVNGAETDYSNAEKGGYAHIDREWSEGDVVEWQLPLRAEWIVAHPEIRANAGKAAIQYGPLVYCLEETDNGKPLASLSFGPDSTLHARFDPGLLGGVVVIETEGRKADENGWSGENPYLPAGIIQAASRVKARAVPYFLWGNRESGEMSVWLRFQA
ncbi:glycoside hydrolase family 127 protein [Cohnella sp. CFH 77786]|uniref:glycoside hydrolase family 127 protein n=1 Tax=Cohnella sp. CFH 77786 TaxID=2662265 RepID=UPI001C60A9EC|nr:beta-L-arabinofuranosidase domain-containing protein [Cohnella sp. CFH 77786]MBW5445320.1 glycoside hydrolase family 127 protein [Cohnella sp. CFH 77786]